MLTGAERSDVSGLSSVVALTIETVGLQTGAVAAGGLMTIYGQCMVNQWSVNGQSVYGQGVVSQWSVFG